MALRAREWTPLDRAAMDAISNARNGMANPPSMRATARAIGVTHPRISGLLAQSAAPPTLDEFCALCDLFGLNPADVLRQALQATDE